MAWWSSMRDGVGRLLGGSDPASASPASGSPAAAPVERVAPPRADPAWPGLPAVQRSLVDPIAPVAGLDAFTSALATRRDPSFLAPLSHQVDPTGGGLADGLADLAPGHPHTYAPASELTVLPAPSRTPPEQPAVQRSWGSFTSQPEPEVVTMQPQTVFSADAVAELATTPMTGSGAIGAPLTLAPAPAARPAVAPSVPGIAAAEPVIQHGGMAGEPTPAAADAREAAEVGPTAERQGLPATELVVAQQPFRAETAGRRPTGGSDRPVQRSAAQSAATRAPADANTARLVPARVLRTVPDQPPRQARPSDPVAPLELTVLRLADGTPPTPAAGSLHRATGPVETEPLERPAGYQPEAGSPPPAVSPLSGFAAAITALNLPNSSVDSRSETSQPVSHEAHHLAPPVAPPVQRLVQDRAESTGPTGPTGPTGLTGPASAGPPAFEAGQRPSAGSSTLSSLPALSVATAPRAQPPLPPLSVVTDHIGGWADPAPKSQMGESISTSLGGRGSSSEVSVVAQRTIEPAPTAGLLGDRHPLVRRQEASSAVPPDAGQPLRFLPPGALPDAAPPTTRAAALGRPRRLATEPPPVAQRTGATVPPGTPGTAPSGTFSAPTGSVTAEVVQLAVADRPISDPAAPGPSLDSPVQRTIEGSLPSDPPIAPASTVFGSAPTVQRQAGPTGPTPHVGPVHRSPTSPAPTSPTPTSPTSTSSAGVSFAAMFGAGAAEAAADGYTSVQLSPEDAAPAPADATPVPAPAPAPGPAPAPELTTAPAGAAPTDLDEMARRLFEPLSARIRAELWLDRERSGMVSDARP